MVNKKILKLFPILYELWNPEIKFCRKRPENGWNFLSLIYGFNLELVLVMVEVKKKIEVIKKKKK